MKINLNWVNWNWVNLIGCIIAIIGVCVLIQEPKIIWGILITSIGFIIEVVGVVMTKLNSNEEDDL